jgi:hypothetical protein
MKERRKGYKKMEGKQKMVEMVDTGRQRGKDKSKTFLCLIT